jgi:hypothetical protein
MPRQQPGIEVCTPTFPVLAGIDRSWFGIGEIIQAR